jgi:hypothetical protein
VCLQLEFQIAIELVELAGSVSLAGQPSPLLRRGEPFPGAVSYIASATDTDLCSNSVSVSIQR